MRLFESRVPIEFLLEPQLPRLYIGQIWQEFVDIRFAVIANRDEEINSLQVNKAKMDDEATARQSHSLPLSRPHEGCILVLMQPARHKKTPLHDRDAGFHVLEDGFLRGTGAMKSILGGGLQNLLSCIIYMHVSTVGCRHYHSFHTDYSIPILSLQIIRRSSIHLV
jgi:hypothetical protein